MRGTESTDNDVPRREQPIGSADDVPDTPSVPGHGTEPNQERRGAYRAQVGSKGGLGATVWVFVAVIALLVLFLYAGGLLS